MNKKVYEEHKLILELLEREPCDAISRQAVLDGLGSIAKVKAKSDAQKALMGRVMFFTEQLPSVTPQPKTGHWKKMVNVYDTMSGTHIRVPYTNEDKKMGNSPVYECECGCDSNKPTNFCPNCGAKMVEPQEGEGIDADSN